MKKIISLLSAFAMIASMAVSVSAAEPEIKLALNFAATGEELSDENYDPDLNFEDYYGAPVYKVELSIEGVSKKASVKEDGTTVAYTGCIVDSIQTKMAYEADKDILCVGSSVISGALTKTTVPGEFTFSWSTATSAEMLKTDKAVIGTWYFVAEDMEAIDEMKVDGFPGYSHIGQINQYWDGTSKTETLKLAPFTPTIVAYPAKADLPADRSAAVKFSADENTFVEITKGAEVKNFFLPAKVKGDATVYGLLKYTVDGTNVASGDIFTIKAVDMETKTATDVATITVE